MANIWLIWYQQKLFGAPFSDGKACPEHVVPTSGMVWTRTDFEVAIILPARCIYIYIHIYIYIYKYIHHLSIIIIIAFFIPLHDHVRNTSRYGLSLKSKGSMDKVAGPWAFEPQKGIRTWTYLRPLSQNFPQTIVLNGHIWYSTSILGSWNSHWCSTSMSFWLLRLLRPCFSRFNSVNSSRCLMLCKA